jgi:cytochrome d ubiquinol oxidase subunit II
MLNSIGPVWDGNEVWLVTAGGALFATFPEVYATFCSGLYLPVMFLLSGLIFRAVAIEFRSKLPSKRWRRTWDILFSVASLAISFVLGCALGNLIRGMPLDQNHEYIGTTLDLFAPYPLLVGFLAVTVFALHGNIYVLMKTDGEFHETVRGWLHPTMVLFIMTYATTTMATLVYEPQMADRFRQIPALFLVALLNMLAIANIPREVNRGCDRRAFLSSCFTIASLMALFALGIFPKLIPASNDPANSLTIYNASSTVLTLKIVLLVALIGIPLVLSYTVGIYWIFRGKVRLDSHSY